MATAAFGHEAHDSHGLGKKAPFDPTAAPGPSEAPKRAVIEDRYDGLMLKLSAGEGMVGDYVGPDGWHPALPAHGR